MNTVKRKSNLETADLLCSLFPAEIEKFVQFIIDNYDKLKSNRPKDFIEVWPELMRELSEHISIAESWNWTNQRLFRDRLFCYVMAYGTIHFLQLYIKSSRKTLDKKFVTLVKYLFF